MNPQICTATVSQERLLAEHEASASAGESKLKAAAAELRAAEARAEGLQRELVACESRLEESGRLLASNQQVIKWLNKELNDAHMLPGASGTIGRTALGATSYGGGGGISTPIRESFGAYNFDRVGGVVGAGGHGAGGGDTEHIPDDREREAGKNAMFTAGLRESLKGDGGLRNYLRGTTLESGAEKEAYFSYPGGREGADGGGVAPAGLGQDTPEHAERTGNHRGGSGGREGHARIVTPESAGVSNPLRFLSTAGKGEGYHGTEGGGEVAGRIDGGNVRGIPAF